MHTEQMQAWLSRRAAQARERGTALRADGRGDEANFETVRANVYEIFHTVLGVAARTGQGDAHRERSFFESRLAQIPQPWRASLERAQAHGDEQKAYIERIKLDALEEITRAWTEADA